MFYELRVLCCCSMRHHSALLWLSFQLTWTAAVAGRFIMHSHDKEKQERVVSYLPLSHIAAQMADIWLAVTFGAQVFFAQPDALKVKKKQTEENRNPTPIHLLVAGMGVLK